MLPDETDKVFSEVIGTEIGESYGIGGLGLGDNHGRGDGGTGDGTIGVGTVTIGRGPAPAQKAARAVLKNRKSKK
ncbi:hypothetical protein [Stenotrophomonas sp.]|uniref:hypothetical protein n=1 Tax=Stenotrophomonas sp. TaxID=69392 RepID=UPI0028A5BCAA|nr:hypothetical protein [Stenotrophomonas sp.]